MARAFAFNAGIVLLLVSGVWAADGGSATKGPQGWEAVSVREEIRPEFFTKEQGGPNGELLLGIRADDREGLDGAWRKTFAVTGGAHYRFSVWQRTEGIAVPRRSVVVQITWQNAQGKLVPADSPVVRAPNRELARPEFPTKTRDRENGWTELFQVYHVPAEATCAVVELSLRWATSGTVSYSGVSWEKTTAPAGRKVRLAAVHFRPRGGKSAADNCKLFAPLIAEAAKQHADLVCMPECLTQYGTGLKYADVAEPIPGPSTEYFGELARKHDLYLVAGLIERSERLIYNTAVLIGPDGKLVGKYRKVCLPREEIAGGITPGTEYPVFDTRFGKVGMMVCWDVHFPEVARNLSNAGAEVIALPIWGGNPDLAKARAIENQVYLVTSTYTDPDADWMRTAVFDCEGKMLQAGEDWGTVIVQEVDLDRPVRWWYLGNFKDRIYRERPLGLDEK